MDNRVGLSRVVKRPVNELSEVDPGQINVSFRAGQKLNVDAAVRATVGVVDEVLRIFRKHSREISSQVHSLFLAEEVDELENDSTNKRVRARRKGSPSGEARVWLLCLRKRMVKSELRSSQNIFILFDLESELVVTKS